MATKGEDLGEAPTTVATEVRSGKWVGMIEVARQLYTCSTSFREGVETVPWLAGHRPPGPAGRGHLSGSTDVSPQPSYACNGPIAASHLQPRGVSGSLGINSRSNPRTCCTFASKNPK